MILFEQMMSNLPRLRHLSLISAGHSDVMDGDRWQIQVSHLTSTKLTAMRFIPISVLVEEKTMICCLQSQLL